MQYIFIQGSKIPYASNPTHEEFLQIARDKNSEYKLYNRINHGVRIGVEGFFGKELKIYIFPGGIFHSIVEDEYELNFDLSLVWDESKPNEVFTEEEYDLEYIKDRLKDKKIENKLKELHDKLNFLGDIKSIQSHNRDPKFAIEFKGVSKDNRTVDVSEPEYASTIRKYHGYNENKNNDRRTFMENIKEAEGLTSTMDMEVTSQKAIATGEKSPEIEAMDTTTAPIVDIYASGKTFEISDNSKIYQCVKVVKDIIDRQFFNQQKTTLNFQFSIDVKKHQVSFDISVSNNQLDEEPLQQLESLADIITDRLNRFFDDSIDVGREIKPILTTDDTSMDNYGRTMMRITVTEKTKE